MIFILYCGYILSVVNLNIDLNQYLCIESQRFLRNKVFYLFRNPNMLFIFFFYMSIMSPTLHFSDRLEDECGSLQQGKGHSPEVGEVMEYRLEL